MRLAILLVLTTTSELAADEVRKSQQPTIATDGKCPSVPRLAGSRPADLAAHLKSHRLTEAALRMVETEEPLTVNTVATIRVGNELVTGVVSNEVKCARPDIRFGVDADNRVFVISAPSWRVDYNTGTCFTTQGTVRCTLGTTINRLYVLPRGTTLGGFLAAPPESEPQLAR